MCWFEYDFEQFILGIRFLLGHHFKQNELRFVHEIVIVVIINVSLGLVTGS